MVFFKSKAIFIVEHCDILVLLATMMIGCDSIPDESVNAVRSKVDVLEAAVSIVLPQLNAMEWWKVPRGIVKKLKYVLNSRQ
ncbi:hypothetical protein TNCV_2627201 [Trichonephila clavipes]|uniref:Uncharacterized protein n=1 Tax=Trichonephila clavipes TaxID=2585209 RepID=A0A8X7BFL0_TRICX|nr:hypothetical protein TNCV_2627201 [Trichonephila clavipes]